MEDELIEYKLANDFARYTNRSFFLTGKAGTGKTTFLRELIKNCHKQVAVTAPTGVAAINAGGVTLHSFFHLPLTPFIPTDEGRKHLFAQQGLHQHTIDILRSLELLIIDEISMVRADTLDEIDATLRHYRKRPKDAFGGVQVIFIGDLYQLAPVTKGEEWTTLSQFYSSPYFFHSHVIQQNPPIYLELTHIFRQDEADFIRLLNEIRDGKLSLDSWELLDSRVNINLTGIKRSDYVVLTTHNNTADAINKEELDKINEEKIEFEAQINGEFPEKMYPNDFCLPLKKGAKVMFIANDSHGHQYYNGKVGIVTKLTEDVIEVTCDGENEPIQVEPETWHNTRYTYNKETNMIEEEELGWYKQYPLRFAWAITIHKSQGLTFDKAIIDLQRAFTPGQVYVALSRCRNINGVVLSSHVNYRSLKINEDVSKYASQKQAADELKALLERGKTDYKKELLQQIFDLEESIKILQTIYSFIDHNTDIKIRTTGQYVDSISLTLHRVKSEADNILAQLNLVATDQWDTLLNDAKDNYISTIKNLEKEVLKLPSITQEEDTLGEFIQYIVDLCEKAERSLYVLQTTNGIYTCESLLASLHSFYKRFNNMEIEFAEKLRDRYRTLLKM